MEPEEIFQAELTICQKQAKMGGCKWGICSKCGVIPLLFKLFKNKIVEEESEVAKLKEKFLRRGLEKEEKH